MNYFIEYIGYGSMNTQYEENLEIKTTLDWNRPAHTEDFMHLVHYNIKKNFLKFKIVSIQISED